MKSALATAFGAGRSRISSITNVYDHAGFIAMRVMFDGKFVDIDESRFKDPSRALKAAQLYNRLNDVMQEKLVTNFSDMIAHGNLGPKPDFKKPVLNLAGVMLNNLGRMSVGQAAVLTLAAGTFIVAAHLTGQGFELAPEVASNYLGSKPSAAAEPKLS